MYDLSIQTHRNLIEPVSQAKHLKFVLLERFFSFLTQIQKSKKQVPKRLLNFIANDVHSTTGSNLRNLLLLTNNDTIEEINIEDIKKLKYPQIYENEICNKLNQRNNKFEIQPAGSGGLLQRRTG